MALSLLVMAFASPLHDRRLFLVLLFLHNLLAAAQDVEPTGWPSIFWPRTSAVAPTASCPQASTPAWRWGPGALVGRKRGWLAAACGSAIALLLIPAMLVIGVRESPSPTQRRHLLRLALRAFSTPVALLAVGFALVVTWLTA